MINVDRLKQVLAAYRRDFHRKPEGEDYTHWELERYKWIAVKHFQDHWDIDAPDFLSMFTKATAKHVNLLMAQNYFPRGMIQEFAKVAPEDTRAMFRNLFNEDISVVDRVGQFISEAERLRSEYGADKWKSHFQNVNSVSTYLWMRYPDKYYIFKYSECKKASEVLQSDFRVKKGATPEVLLNFNSFYDEIASCVAEDLETVEMVQAALTPECYPDPAFRTLTIDIGFYISRFYSKAQGEHDETASQELAVPVAVKYWPSYEQYPINITKEQWKKYIEEVELPHHKGCMKMLKALMELGGEASCKTLSEMYGGNPTRYVGSAVNIGRRAKKYFNLPPCMDGDVERFFPIPFIGRHGNELTPGCYSYRIRDELHEALKEIDLSSIDPHVGTEMDEEEADELSEGTNYWWLNANPNIWSYNSIAVGEQQSYTLYNDNGNKRRVFQNFLDARAGDKIICYESTPVKQVVALAKISKEQDGKELFFEKTEGLTNPIDYQALKDSPELAEMEVFQQGQGSLFRLTKQEYDVIMDLIREMNPLPGNQVEMETYTQEDFLNEVYMDSTQYDLLTSLLKNKRNVILQGPPGVGKTFAAKRVSYSMMGKKDDSRIEMVQFHQNYTYEDFMMGYKPTENGFELRFGVFYRFCMLASNHPDQDYFFIIDEINRGNLSKIFGELLMLIEKTYRNTKVTLAYNGMPFSVPDNLYIIGMMNTADRSLAMIDYALRRRFSFYTMKPGFDTEGFMKYQEGLASNKLNKMIDVVKELNKTIAADKSLGPGFCIGHSYFGNHRPEEGDAWLYEVVNYDLIPMLQEYWFDDSDNVGKWADLLKGAING